MRRDSGGYPILPPNTSVAMSNGKARAQLDGVDLARLVDLVSSQLGAPVKDATGLAGTYDIALFWSIWPPSADPAGSGGPGLPEALEEQLGLKLERRKGPGEVLVVDHAEEVPTAN